MFKDNELFCLLQLNIANFKSTIDKLVVQKHSNSH